MTGSSVPAIVGTLAFGARRRVGAHFFAQHAIGAEDAVHYVPQRPIEARQFELLRRRSLIREAGPGRYWIDLPAWRREEERRRAVLVPWVILAAVTCAGLLLFFYRG